MSQALKKQLKQAIEKEQKEIHDEEEVIAS